MINVEKLMLDLHRQGLNRKEVDKKFNNYGVAENFDSKIASLDDMSKDMVAIMKMGFMANCENQKEMNGKVSANEAKYETIMDLYGLTTDNSVRLSTENKLVLYTNVIDLMNKMETKNLVESLNEVRKHMEKGLFNKVEANYNHEACAKKVTNKAKELENSFAM
ncbi:MAG: hypothetical protein IJW82_02000 [Clostridia bacterium]|nr:hypothetical protein [Clostridia bacterium]